MEQYGSVLHEDVAYLLACCGHSPDAARFTDMYGPPDTARLVAVVTWIQQLEAENSRLRVAIAAVHAALHSASGLGEPLLRPGSVADLSPSW
jgi:hypothetical protein